MVLNLGTQWVPGSLYLESKYICYKSCQAERKTDFCTSKYCRSSSVKSLGVFLSLLEATLFLPLGLMKVTLNGLRGSLSFVGAKFLSSGELILFHNGYTLQSY